RLARVDPQGPQAPRRPHRVTPPPDVVLVGLTGGIGSGKSTVSRMLAERGAVIVDADDLARRAVEPGTPGFEKVVEAFGPDVVRGDGSLDRDAIAARVFA